MLESISKRCTLNIAGKSAEEALSRLVKLEAQATDEDLATLDVGVLLSASLVLVFHFQDKVVPDGLASDGSHGVTSAMLNSALTVYEKIVRRLGEKHYKEIIETAIATIEEKEAWDRENLCRTVLERVSQCVDNAPFYIAPLLDIMEKMMEESRMMNARQVIRILYELLGSQEVSSWLPLTEGLTSAVTRLFNIFGMSQRPAANGERKYASVGKGLAVCARRLLSHIHQDDQLQFIKSLADWCLEKDLPDEALLEFAYMLEVVASHHVTQIIQDTLDTRLLQSVMGMISSEKRIVSLLGNRVLQHLLDRTGNRKACDTPKIFYQDTDFPLHAGCYSSEDTVYMRRNRALIHDSFITAFITHGYHRINLEATYASVCLMVLEVPGGYMAAATTCLVMHLQERAFKTPTLTERTRWHLHAVVMSIMSLIAWINTAVDLYKYLNQVMKMRADEASHLNPPLLTSYNFAPHQVRWDRPNLFFDNWEVRYCLWMHFRKAKGDRSVKEPGATQQLKS